MNEPVISSSTRPEILKYPLFFSRPAFFPFFKINWIQSIFNNTKKYRNDDFREKEKSAPSNKNLLHNTCSRHLQIMQSSLRMGEESQGSALFFKTSFYTSICTPKFRFQTIHSPNYSLSEVDWTLPHPHSTAIFHNSSPKTGGDGDCCSTGILPSQSNSFNENGGTESMAAFFNYPPKIRLAFQCRHTSYVTTKNVTWPTFFRLLSLVYLISLHLQKNDTINTTRHPFLCVKRSIILLKLILHFEKLERQIVIPTVIRENNHISSLLPFSQVPPYCYFSLSVATAAETPKSVALVFIQITLTMWIQGKSKSKTQIRNIQYIFYIWSQPKVSSLCSTPYY